MTTSSDRTTGELTQQLLWEVHDGLVIDRKAVLHFYRVFNSIGTFQPSNRTCQMSVYRRNAEPGECATCALMTDNCHSLLAQMEMGITYIIDFAKLNKYKPDCHFHA